MNFGFFGVQFSFGLQQSNMSAIYKYLGAEESELPLLWLAGPVTGLIVQPIIGAISDGTWSPKFGRRKPFFLIGAVIASLALIAMPYSSSIWMAAGLLWILDAANNIALEPYRAFISDMLPKKQFSFGFLVQSFFTGLGTTLANFTPAILVSFGILALADKMDNGIPVYTYWDLGINDDMVLWLMQPHGKELRLIACYGNRDEGMEHYINWLNDFKDKYGIRFGEHLAPHDISVRNLMTRESRLDTAKRMGIKFKLVPRCESKRESINALKKLFPRIWIDKTRCDTDIAGNTGDLAHKTGWKGLKALRREWDHNNEVFKDAVGPKWATNFTDAIQQMGLHYKEPVQRQKPRPRQRATSGGWLGS